MNLSDIRNRMAEQANNPDDEVAHIEADKALVDLIIRLTSLNNDSNVTLQVQEILALYEQVASYTA